MIERELRPMQAVADAGTAVDRLVELYDDAAGALRNALERYLAGGRRRTPPSGSPSATRNCGSAIARTGRCRASGAPPPSSRRPGPTPRR